MKRRIPFPLPVTPGREKKGEKNHAPSLHHRAQKKRIALFLHSRRGQSTDKEKRRGRRTSPSLGRKRGTTLAPASKLYFTRARGKVKKQKKSGSTPSLEDCPQGKRKRGTAGGVHGARKGGEETDA